MSYYKNFIKEILSKSASDEWIEARNEWIISGAWEQEDLSGYCICGKDDCRYQFELYNTATREIIYPVGSECIKKFHRSDFDETVGSMTSLHNLAHECKSMGRINIKMLSRKLIRLFYLEGWLKPNKYNDYDPCNDYTFLLEMFNRRSPMTINQKRKVQAILRESIIPNLKKLLNE